MPDSESYPPMSPAARELVQAYAEALREYLSGSAVGALRRAYELGLQAVSQGVDILEITAVHHQAMAEVLFKDGQACRKDDAAKALDALCAACPAWYSSSEAVPARPAWVLLAQSLSPAIEDQKALRRTNSALRRLNEMREEEAKRIAHELHDDAAQLVAAAHLSLEELAEREQLSGEALDAVRARLDEIGERLRTLSHELRPSVLDDFGLTAALEALARGLAARSGLHITISSVMDDRLPPGVETTLYRIVQECLRNVSKHAEAHSATVSVRRQVAEVVCSVVDDGKGFSVAQVLRRKAGRGLGLLGIQERVEALGGTLRISSHPLRGTEIFVRIPLEQPPAAAHEPLRPASKSAAHRLEN